MHQNIPSILHMFIQVTLIQYRSKSARIRGRDRWNHQRCYDLNLSWDLDFLWRGCVCISVDWYWTHPHIRKKRRHRHNYAIYRPATAVVQWSIPRFTLASGRFWWLSSVSLFVVPLYSVANFYETNFTRVYCVPLMRGGKLKW